MGYTELLGNFAAVFTLTTPEGRKSRGRPKETWRRTAEKDNEQHFGSWSAAAVAARDRVTWQRRVLALYPLRVMVNNIDDDDDLH